MRMKSVVVVGRLMSRRLLSGKEVREGFGSGQTGFFFFPLSSFWVRVWNDECREF